MADSDPHRRGGTHQHRQDLAARTLTRDTSAKSPTGPTARHVEGARLRIEGDALEWFDTPGMEDSISLLEYLERLEAPGERLDGPRAPLPDTPEAHGR